MAYTVTPEFNKALEVQQSKHRKLNNFFGAYLQLTNNNNNFFFFRCVDLAAGIDINLQNDHIEEMINRQVPILQVLRLLCLQSLVSGGLKQKSFEFFKKEILQVLMNCFRIKI